jgi:hypothetical protein
MRFGRWAGYGTIGVLCLVLGALPLRAQVSPSPFVVPQYLTNSGQPCSGCKLASFAAGTSTPLATFSDPSGVFPNSNPVILDSAGRARIYLTGASYKLVLSTAAGTQIWSVDQVASSNNGLLSSANTWTGVNTFNATTNFGGPVNMAVGFTSLGPNVLNGGGALAGTWTGSPTFSGTPTFASGFMATTGSFTGQITSSVGGGLAPLIVASNVQVANLNASFLEGCTWEGPCAIGGTSPAPAIFTTLRANTSFTMNGSTPQTSIQGSADGKLLSAGTFSGAAGVPLCKDANGGATTSGCATSGFSQIETGTILAPCTPPSSSSFDACNSTVTWPAAFADASYQVTCSLFEPNANGGNPATNSTNQVYIGALTAANATVIVQNLRSAANTPGAIFCIAVHP